MYENILKQKLMSDCLYGSGHKSMSFSSRFSSMSFYGFCFKTGLYPSFYSGINKYNRNEEHAIGFRSLYIIGGF